MGTEVEHASTTPPSTTSTSATKTSMFAKRSGFVIPKNKLSGSLVRVHKGTKKGDADLMNEEANKQAQRKTKWGPDLTMDSTVRKGRALAYQVYGISTIILFPFRIGGKNVSVFFVSGLHQLHVPGASK